MRSWVGGWGYSCHFRIGVIPGCVPRGLLNPDPSISITLCSDSNEMPVIPAITQIQVCDVVYLSHHPSENFSTNILNNGICVRVAIYYVNKINAFLESYSNLTLKLEFHSVKAESLLIQAVPVWVVPLLSVLAISCDKRVLDGRILFRE